MTGTGGISMLREEALVYLKAMLEGVDPVTGELFDEEHVCCDEHVREALKTAVQVLDETEESIGRWTKKNGQLHAARPWTDEECEHLTALYCDGKEMDEICTILQRRWRGVLNKMVELGLVRAADIEKKKRRKQKSSASKTQKSWTAIDDKTLWEMYEQYQPIDKMAEVLQRSRYAVYCRMERFGMTGFADGYPKDQYGQRTDGSDRFRKRAYRAFRFRAEWLHPNLIYFYPTKCRIAFSTSGSTSHRCFSTL